MAQIIPFPIRPAARISSGDKPAASGAAKTKPKPKRIDDEQFKSLSIAEKWDFLLALEKLIEPAASRLSQ